MINYKEIDVFVVAIQSKNDMPYNTVHHICNGKQEVLRTIKEVMAIKGHTMSLADLNFCAIDCDRAMSDGHAQVDNVNDTYITTLYVNTITIEEKSDDKVTSPLSVYVFQATDKELLTKRGFTVKLLLYELRRFIRAHTYTGPMNQRHITQENREEIKKRIHFIASCCNTLDMEYSNYAARLYALADLYEGVEWISPETFAEVNKNSITPIKAIRHYISPISCIEHRYTEHHIM